MKHTILVATIVLGGVSLAFFGCGSPWNTADQTSDSSTHAADEHGGHADHGERDQGEHAQADRDMVHAELAKLSPEDAASAKSQRVCPVSGELLGVMGPPEKIDVNGQQVWICCDGCQDTLLASPAEYLAKLKSN